MLTDDDIQKLISVFATRDEISSMLENKADKEDIRNLVSAVDSYAKRAETIFQELVMLSHRVNRHEKWLRQIAEKVGVNLED